MIGGGSEGQGVTDVIIEYATVKKGTGYCDRGVKAAWSDRMEINHLWVDQFTADGIQIDQTGPFIVERSLFTRLGANGGGSVHADVFQCSDGGGITCNRSGEPHPICILGSRAVPVYTNPNQTGSGCYKISNFTQNGPSVAKWYVYNNWIDGSTNNMVASNGNEQVRKNKFGYFFQYGAWAGANDLGGNINECNGSAVNPDRYEESCLWGWNSWLGADQSGWPPSTPCFDNFDEAPIDPTKNGWPPP
jgi:hypothetical protein